jgi:RimJ/RimL family protein N-acetyltransferase
MALHVATVYRHDGRNRLAGVNDWMQRPVPRLWLGRTREGVIWRFRSDLPDSLCAALERYCRAEPPCETHPGTAPRLVHEYGALLNEHAPVERYWSGPTCWFPAIPPGETTAVPITTENAHLLAGALEPWRPDVPHQQPMFAALVNDVAAAVCASVRITDIAHAAGVETAPGHRQRGLATAAVIAWARAVMSSGRIAFYSTWWENLASQRLAARAGAVVFGEEYHIT